MSDELQQEFEKLRKQHVEVENLREQLKNAKWLQAMTQKALEEVRAEVEKLRKYEVIMRTSLESIARADMFDDSMRLIADKALTETDSQ